jgi:WD40 repeat protein/Cdc6-like AAA superfamily ATPase
MNDDDIERLHERFLGREFPTAPRKGEVADALSRTQDPLERLASAYGAWETRRVFVSTTFADMAAERSYLVEVLIPELREMLSGHRVHLDEVDLRWGITHQQAQANETLSACLAQIDGCNLVLGILGSRRGSCPDLRTTQVKSIRTLRGIREPSFTEIELHYSHERNPQSLILLRRQITNPWDIPAEFHDFAVTSQGTEETIRLPPGGRECLPYQLEFTGFRVPRDFKNRTSFPGSDALAPGAFLSLADFQALRSELPQEFASRLRLEFAGLDAFGKLVREALWQRLKPTLPPASKERTPAIGEAEQHFRELGRHRKVFAPWSQAETWLDEFLGAAGARLALVTGPHGSGKSALLAALTAKVVDADKQACVCFHCTSVSTEAATMTRVVERLLQTILQTWSMDEALSSDRIEYAAVLDHYISRAPGMILLIVDGAEALQAPFDWEWLPAANGRIKCVVSSLDGTDATDRLRSLCDRHLPIGGMGAEIGHALIDATVKKMGKSVADADEQLLLARSRMQPVEYLVVALEELRVFATYDSVLDRIGRLPESIVALYDELIDSLEQLDRCLARAVLPFLAMSPFGLSEVELFELCGITSAEPARMAGVRELLHRLRTHIIRSGPLIHLASDRLKEAIHRRFLATESAAIGLQRRLLDFGKTKISIDNPHKRNSDLRWLRLIPEHAIASREYKELFHLYSNLGWLQAYLRGFGLDVFLRDFERFRSRAERFLSPNVRQFLDALGKALRLAVPGLLFDPESLAQQLAGRLSEPMRRTLFRTVMVDSDNLLPRGRFLSPGPSDLVAALPAVRSDLHAVDVDSHGRFVAAGLDDGAVMIWDTQAIQRPAILYGHQTGIWTEQRGVGAIELSPSGEFLVSGGDDGAVRVWDTRRRVPTAIFGHREPVYVLQPGRRPGTVVSAGMDGFVLEWDVERLRQDAIITNHGSPVLALALTADRGTMITAGADKIIRVWDVTASHSVMASRARLEHILKGHRDVIIGLAVVRDVLYSCSRDGQLSLWDLKAGTPIREQHCADAGISSFAPTFDGHHVCFGTRDGSVGVLDCRTGSIVTAKASFPRFDGPPASDTPGPVKQHVTLDGVSREYPGIGSILLRRSHRVHGGALHPGGEWFVSVSGSGDVLSWDLHARRTSHLAGKDETALYSAAFSPDGRYCAATGREGVVLLFDLVHHSRISCSEGIDANAVLFVENAVLTAGQDGYLRRYPLDLSGSDLVGGHPVEGISAVSVSPCGTRIASVDEGGVLRIWDLNGGGERERFHDLLFESPIAFNQVTRQVAGQTLDGQSFVMNLDTLERRQFDPCLPSRHALRAEAGQIPSHEVDGVGDESCGSTSRPMPELPFHLSIHGGSIWLLRNRTGARLTHHAEPGEALGSAVVQVRLSPSKELAVAIQADGKFRVWQARTPGIPGMPQTIGNEGLRALELLHDARAIALDGAGALHVVRLPDGTIIEPLENPVVAVDRFFVNQEKSTILTIGADGTGRILQRNLDPGVFPEKFQKAFLSRQGRYVAGQVGDDVRLYTRGGEEICRFSPSLPLVAFACHPEDLYVVLGFNGLPDESVSHFAVWNQGDDEFEEFGDANNIGVESMCWSGRDNHFVVARQDHRIELWDAREGERIKELRVFNDRVFLLEAAQEGGVVVAASRSRLVVWALPEGEVLASFVPDAAITACALSPDGREVIVGDQTGQVMFFELMRSRAIRKKRSPASRKAQAIEPLTDLLARMSTAEDADELRKLTSRASRLYPDRKPLIYEARAKALIELGQPQEAEAVITNFFHYKKEATANLHYWQAIARIRCAGMGLESERNTRYHAMRNVAEATERWKRGKWFKASLALQQAIAIDPTHADAHFVLGLANVELGSPAGAMVHFEAAARLGHIAAANALECLLKEHPRLATLPPRKGLAPEGL